VTARSTRSGGLLAVPILASLRVDVDAGMADYAALLRDHVALRWLPVR